MRRVITTLSLALCLLGCTGEVKLLTGADGCYAGGENPTYAGVLVPDPEYGTRIDGKGPVMWPSGYTGSRLAEGQIAVLDGSGNVVARTGREYAIANAPHPGGEAGQLMDRIGAIPAVNCYGWDLVDCTASAENPGIAERGCPPTPSYDLAAVKASFLDECQDPSVLEGEACERIDVDGMRGDDVYLTVPTTGLHRHPKRAQVVCEQIASAHDDLAGEPLGYEIVTIEGKNNKFLAECNIDA
jgi:hypothetical protein